MNIRQTLQDKEFLKKDQFEKRDILKPHILIDKNCKIGSNVICFEIETFIKDKDKFFHKGCIIHKTSTLTIGEEYKILDHTEGKIKIKNNLGKNVWCTINRFLYYSSKQERKEKLEQIIKNRV
jgi:predicted acyltransferase (DUF342 family)